MRDWKGIDLVIFDRVKTTLALPTISVDKNMKGWVIGFWSYMAGGSIIIFDNGVIDSCHCYHIEKIEPFKKDLWMKTEIQRIPELDNDSLLEEYRELSGGDDYDGMMTDRGQFTYVLLDRELKIRLRKIGFLKPLEE